MAYEVRLTTTAAKALLSLTRAEQVRITKRTNALAENPRPAGAVKLTGSDGWRIRVGDYRVVYLIADTVRVVTITRVAHRREVYRRL
ncbi:MAG TPA: type II toxin-antitoxin system RelE/ParE family toxin [Dermatophilaceae bacterium]|nr:type II toxin-antitoxin system RelE/ParE family toxin [Dermatophilaceae bacterium]